MRWKEWDFWYVNLASRPDRDVHARHQFARHGLSVRRFEAFLPDQWPGDPAKVARMLARTPGAVGCHQSQTAVISKVAGTDRVVCVCEDDVVFCDDLTKRFQYIQDALTWDWDVFYLGATFHVPGVWCHHPDCASWGAIGRDAEPTADKHIMRVYGEWGTYAYLVNGRNAATVLRLLDENMAVSDGIDHNFIRLGDKVNAFCFVPGCAWQYDNQSNIGTGITRFSGFKELGPYAWTDRMEEFDPARYDWDKGGG